jgi:hypothetical protein
MLMVSAPQAPTKAELLEALRSSGREVEERLGALPVERFEEGRYEGGWNGRGILAHIASIEWTYPRLLDIAKEAQTSAQTSPEVRTTEAGEAKDVPTRTAQGGILSYNDRQVEKRADASVEDLLAEFKTNRAATIAAVEAADDALFSREIRSAGGITGPLAGVINSIAVLHVRAHVNDILGDDR